MFRVAAMVTVVLLLFVLPVAPVVAEPEEEDNCDQLSQIQTDAEHDDPKAEMQLSKLYFSGKCVAQDLKEGAKLIDSAAGQGYAPAQARLAVILYEGKQYDEAAKWARRAAEQGDNGGEALLGRLYYLGKGVPQSDAEALKWVRQSADHGNGLGQGILAGMYDDGRGVPKDDIEAEKWYILVDRTEYGNIWSTLARKKIELGLSKKDIAEAQRRADAWKPKPENKSQ